MGDIHVDPKLVMGDIINLSLGYESKVGLSMEELMKIHKWLFTVCALNVASLLL